ncbi:hypothetical protein ABZY19_30710 [Streptomyces sp. NPDC006475]|uniref:hypothetical protein n=1 Tax=Streptomyces sp. NPDC006475 TaxID=3155719 RepID=UPI0033BDE1C4
MADDPTAAGAHPEQIPARVHAAGPGWRQLLEHLHEQIRAAFPGYRLLDLKEKFGGLRVYVEGPPGSGDILRSLIAPAEAEAERTCEFCGATGRVRTRGDQPGGWRKAVCDTCHSAWSAHHIMIVCGAVRDRR